MSGMKRLHSQTEIRVRMKAHKDTLIEFEGVIFV